MFLVVDHNFESMDIRAFGKDGSGRSVPIEDEGAAGEAEKLKKCIRASIGKGRISAISFRILFGGDCFDGPVLIDPVFFERFGSMTELFPFYVPPVIDMIKRFQSAFPDVPLIAFFETSFFRTLPDEEKYYALPLEYCEENKIRKWGFHGIYHEANAGIVPAARKVISVVFDKQTTICAVRDKNPLSISLGYTPLEGVMSRTSCGDLDPGIVFYLMNVHKYSIYQIDDMLKNQSGFVGLTGYDIELADMLKLLGKDAKVDLAFDVYRAQMMKYIGEGISVLGGLDELVFSGSNVLLFSPVIYDIVKKISFLGINVSGLPWEGRGEVIGISSDESKIKVYINKMDIAKIIFLRSKTFLNEIQPVSA